VVQEAPQENLLRQDKPPSPEFPVPQEVVEPATTPAPDEFNDIDGLRAAVRGGAWFVPEFEAQTAGGRRRLKSTSMGDVGLDLDARWAAWLLRVSFDAAQGDDLSVRLGGLHVGRVESLEGLGLPVTVAGSVGVIAGALDVDVAGFGDFDRAVGFQARGELTWPTTGRWGVSLWADYRRLDIEYEEPVLSGDDEAWGSTVALGGALIVRF
ncbi:MAG TPA: hypothetical protein VEJ18_03850, partial [Planctomycetota bacterium]|nr:hypothetical protein [Planctomycetota bacterium]